MSSWSFSSEVEPLARAVLAHFPVEQGQMCLDRPEHAHGFSGAMIVRVKSDDATYCLRRWPFRELPGRRINELHRFLRFAHNAGCRVLPVPLNSMNGETLVEHCGNLWQLEPWMPGVADFWLSPTDVRLQSVMRVLAQVHHVASQYQPADAGQQWFSMQSSQPSPAVGERLSMINQWTPAWLNQTLSALRDEPDESLHVVARQVVQQYRESRDTIRSALMRVSETAVMTHPCLRDVWHDHVLFTGDKVTGLVDPSATRTESVASDLSRLLGSLLGDNIDRWNDALRSYEQVRPLSLAEHQLIHVLHASGMFLSALTWIDRRIKRQISEDVMPRVVERMNRTCECIEHLCSRQFCSAVARRLL